MTQPVQCFKDNAGTIHESEFDSLVSDLSIIFVKGRDNDKTPIVKLTGELVADLTVLRDAYEIIGRLVDLHPQQPRATETSSWELN